MKQIVGRSEVFKSLDLGSIGLPIYVVTDASLVGSGGYIAQGETLEIAKPAVHHSRVFNPAQTNYPVHEQHLALEDTSSLTNIGLSTDSLQPSQTRKLCCRGRM